MKVTSFTVGFNLTYNLGDYQNVKPSLTMTVQVEDGDDLGALMTSYADSCRAFVYGEIDRTLETFNRSPKFTEDPLYFAAEWKQRKAWVILPHELRCEKLPGSWYRRTESMRYDAVWDRVPDDAYLIDCANGDLDPILNWWNAQKFYHLYALRFWISKWDSKKGAYLLVRDGLAAPGQREYIDRLAPEQAQRIEEMTYLDTAIPQLIADDQETLDSLIAQWIADHPRPDIEAGDVPPEDDEYQPSEDDENEDDDEDDGDPDATADTF